MHLLHIYGGEAASLILKGQCHEKKSLGAYKINQNFLYLSADGFHNLAAFLSRKLKKKLKFLIASMKSLTNSGKSFKYVTLFRKIVPTFR
jgi:hypothetical protein